jgi:Protein of unknown function (DUF3054)
VRLFPPSRFAVAADTAAILVFAVIGNLSHHGDVSARGLARDVLPLLGGWLGAGVLFGLYRRPTLGRLAATWLVGVTAGVVVRAAVLRHTNVGKEAAFLAVALVFTLLFALAARALTAWALLRARPRARQRASS